MSHHIRKYHKEHIGDLKLGKRAKSSQTETRASQTGKPDKWHHARDKYCLSCRRKITGPHWRRHVNDVHDGTSPMSREWNRGRAASLGSESDDGPSEDTPAPRLVNVAEDIKSAMPPIRRPEARCQKCGGASEKDICEPCKSKPVNPTASVAGDLGHWPRLPLERGFKRRPAQNPLKLTPPSNKKRKEAVGREPYTYSALVNAITFREQKFNVYGVVLDASAPYLPEYNPKYMCMIKLIDDSVNPLHPVPYNFIQLTIFDSNRAKVPFITTIGSILRIHRADHSIHERIHQLNCDVGIKGAWVLWHHSESAIPIAHSGRTFTETPQDQARVINLRKWARTFFKNHHMPGIPLAIADREGRRNFDLLVYVLEVREKGDFVVARVCDEHNVRKINVPKGPMEHISPCEVVRVRACFWQEFSGKRRIVLIEPSLILEVPKKYAASKILRKAINGSKSPETAKAVKLFTPRMPYEIVTEITKGKSPRIFELCAIFMPKKKCKGTRYRVQVEIVKIYGSLDDWVQIINKQTNKT